MRPVKIAGARPTVTSSPVTIARESGRERPLRTGNARRVYTRRLVLLLPPNVEHTHPIYEILIACPSFFIGHLKYSRKIYPPSGYHRRNKTTHSAGKIRPLVNKIINKLFTTKNIRLDIEKNYVRSVTTYECETRIINDTEM